MIKNISKIILVATAGLMLSVSGVMAQWPVWTSYFGGNTTGTLYNGAPVPIGSIIEAYMSDGGNPGIKVGSTMVSDNGKYGFIDITNSEGLITGDPILFYINARPTISIGPDDPVFGTMGDTKEVNLTAEGVVQADFSSPAIVNGAPGATITIPISIHNTGDGIDFYMITAINSNNGWLLEYSTEFTYIKKDEIGEVTFNLIVPPGILSGSDEVSFTVSSMIDPSVSYTASTLALISTTDVEDEAEGQLPVSFRLMQNYPNPFNPGTTLAFEIPTALNVTIEIYNLLGERVEKADLGLLRAGLHTYDFTSESLASGIYLYRVKAGDFSAIRKMVLLK